MGGTRFVGKALVSKLLSKGHELTLFTRGLKPVPSNLEHFGNLENLKLLWLGNNRLTTLPDEITQLKSLMGLGLQNNNFSVQRSLGNLRPVPDLRN